jgi:putative ABC transport system permease protein
MLSNYLVTFLRHLGRHRLYNGINLAGLSLGLACCLVCYLHIRYEYSYDRFHRDGHRIFRLVTGDPAATDSWVKMAAPVSPKLKADLPEVEAYVRLNPVTYNDQVTVECRGKTFLEPWFLMADSSFFSVFDYPLLAGEQHRVLAGLNDIALSASTAARLFGDDDPMGQIVTLKEHKLDFVVSGIFADFPHNTHLRCDYLISFQNLDRLLGQGRSEAWGEFNYFAYLKLHPGADPRAVEAKIRAMRVEFPGNDPMTFADFRLQPLAAIHFEGNRGNMLPSYDVRYLYIFATLSLSVFIICLMNYFNISSMLAIRRLREIGIRKAVGASTSQLNRQFLLESAGIAALCLLAVVLLVAAFRPLLEDWLGSPVVLALGDPAIALPGIGLGLLLTLLSSGVVATVVNRFRPGTALKGIGGKGVRQPVFQQVLLFVQFGLSAVLLCGSVIIVQQVRHLQRKDLGFDQDQVVNVRLPRDCTFATLSALTTGLKTSGRIDDVALSNFNPGGTNWHQTVWWEGQTEPQSMFVVDVGPEFIPAMKIELLEGSVEELRAISDMQFIVNESALRQMSWDTGKGRLFSPFGEDYRRPLLGVVKDFHFRSLHNGIAPLLLVVFPERNFGQLSVRLHRGDIAGGLHETERIFRSVLPEVPFEFTFLDEAIHRLYEKETRLERIVVVLTLISIAFALLGIFSLMSFAIEQRTREVAIRKVMGISPVQLIALFTSKYLLLAVLASALALPVGWKLLGAWLGNFSHRISLQALDFAGVFLLILGLVLLVGLFKYLSLKKVNPALLLRAE